MARCSFCSLKKIRTLLDKTQNELALLLGISVRAVQSYEQGWRKVPSHILRSMAMLLFLNWRKSQTWISPCWDVKSCPADVREKCAAWNLRAGDICWLVNGTRCGETCDRSWEEKAARCAQCPVTERWLNPAQASGGEPSSILATA
jgi:DNA-binding XRE family transcriptional regulator